MRLPLGSSADREAASARCSPTATTSKAAALHGRAIMSQVAGSDVAELRARANRLRDHAGLIGDDEAANKLLEVADDLDSWASRLEWDAEREAAP